MVNRNLLLISFYSSQISNYKSGHEFEGVVQRLLELNMILANEIKVTQGDGGIDIIAVYKKHTILIQCKNVESPITVNNVRDFESSISRYSNPFGFIVYNEKKMKTKNCATQKANKWIASSEQFIKICSETEICNIIKEFCKEDFSQSQLELFDFSADNFVYNEVKSQNVHIKKIVIRKRYNPY